MIKYSLICKDCDLTFESWFASSKEYEKLKRKKLLNCHSCNSVNIQKNLMAPSLINKKSEVSLSKEIKKYNRIKKTISEYQSLLKTTLNKRNNFAYEARSIHYNEKRKRYLWHGLKTRFERIKRRGNRCSNNTMDR